MVVALIALVVAASGTAVAASKLVKGDSLIAKRSLSGNRLKNHTVTGKQIKISSLGKVNSAKNADHATVADSATNATNAGNATTLGGQAAGAFEAASNWTRSGLVGAALGQTVPLTSFGPFTLSLRCVDNGSSGPEAQIAASSSQAGSTAEFLALPNSNPIFDVGPDTAFEQFSGTEAFVSPSAGTFLGLVTAGVNSPASTQPCVAMALVSKS
jgi:hypothetical protein